ncbi:cysteine/Histidine-rich C1 domain family protein [Tasmannia lanceolata]|uniref:cysteine/Histidine-rich C1 domain family protein n=1 Tax=Tasmannia lanceolata TaxID=3420 RepID=UPI0040640206
MGKYGEITHFSHPQHKLKFEYIEAPFKCDGCKEVGIGSRYKCDFCDFDLHRHCAIPSPVIYHPFYTKCSFQFLARPPGEIPRFCNACEKDVNGFVYHCKSCGFDLHPCCANLPRVLEDGEMKLFLYRKVCASCHKCGRKGRSWSYRSECKKYNLHVACAREMLVDSWHEIYIKKAGGTSNRKLETRIPSLRGTLANHHRRRGRVKKCCEIAGMAVQIIISAVLGDPTAIIAGVIGSFIPR